MSERVLVVGGGASGLAAAWALGRAGNRFAVEVWESAEHPGGVATSVPLDDGSFFNDGVQAAAPSYANTLRLHRALGFTPTPFSVRIAFGRGDDAWGNTSDSALVRSLRPEIARFARLLPWIARAEPMSVVTPIAPLLRMLGFSERFRNVMVLPLVALFFGTGNQTASVPAALVARVFLDPEARLFDLDGERLLSTEPTMLAFPSLSHLYASLATASGAGIRCGRRVLSIERSPTRVLARAADGACAHFDQVIFACDAESALMVLGDDATTMERGVLGSVRYYDDLTVTHGDVDYMRRHYTLRRDPDHYLVRIDPTRREHIEMSFVLTAYQPQLANRDRPLFQTIFLDESRAAEWTRSEIARDAVVLEKRWRQFAHTWRHFAWTVPRGRLVQGRRRTRYAGTWTFMNTHEMATLSGFAAAAALGAPVPFADDPACARGFSLYRSVAYGR